MSALDTPHHTLPISERAARRDSALALAGGQAPLLPEALGDLVLADATSLVCGRIDATWRTARSDDSVWAARVAAGLEGEQRAVVAFSFEDDQPAVAHRLGTSPACPDQLDRRLVVGAACAAPAGTLEAAARRHWVNEQPSAATYLRHVQRALAEITSGHVHKVVVGRGLEILSDPPVPAAQVLHHLAVGPRGRPAGRYLYAVPVEEGSLLVGASPELLVRRRGDLVEAMPLAGSMPRAVEPDRDRATRQLLASAKDRAEHDHVVQDLVHRLHTVACQVQTAPVEVIGTDTMWHLATRVSARLAPDALADPSHSALALARVVHPTPAVAGVPTPEARALLADLEGAPRGWFAGAVGWVDATGDGEFALTLRSGVLRGASLRAWAGAGIVAGSDPQSELRETGAKLSTMAAAVGL